MYVQLARDWTDGEGVSHSAGELVDVDASTLAELEAAGIAAGFSPPDSVDSWPGPSAATGDWAGPTGSGEDESWAG